MDSANVLLRLAGELEERAQIHAEKRAEVKKAEADDRASGKLKDGQSYEATWNYHEGLAAASERAAQLLRKEAEGLPKSKLEEWCERAKAEGKFDSEYDDRLRSSLLGLDAEYRERLEEIADLLQKHAVAGPAWEPVAFLRRLASHQPEPQQTNSSKDGWTASDAAIDAAWRAVEELDDQPTIHRNVIALAVSAAFLAESQQEDEIVLRLSRPSAIRLEQHLTNHYGEGRLVQEVRAAFEQAEPQQEGRGEL